jgi:hypothetical protein
MSWRRHNLEEKKFSDEVVIVLGQFLGILHVLSFTLPSVFSRFKILVKFEGEKC